MIRNKRFSFKVNLLVFSILYTLNMATVVQADPNANILKEQDRINENVNVLNIAMATNGYSVNPLTSFDVPEVGLILNNSLEDTETKLSGHITANSNLSGNAAKDIILEVNSKKATLLNGPVEVAGTNARVILSNPSGIICSSCSFLSSHSVVLTTGMVDTQNNVINGYKVEKGNITLNGKSIFDETLKQVNVIARNVAIEGVVDMVGIDINMITGANEVKEKDNAVTPLKGSTGTVSKYSLQVIKDAEIKGASLKFIGTEVRAPFVNNGKVESGDGGIDIVHQGILNNEKGNVVSKGDICIVFSKGVINKTGNIKSVKSIFIDTEREKIDNILGSNIAAIGNVTIHSGELKNSASYIASEDKVNIQTYGKPITNIATIGESVGIAAINGIKINSGIFNNNEAEIRSNNFIDIDTNKKEFNNIKSHIDASGHINVNSGAINNNQSRLRSVTSLSIDTNGNALKNTGLTGDTASDDSLGILSGEEGMTVVINKLENDKGIIATDGNMNFQNKGNIKNEWGQIKAGGFLTFYSDEIKNQYGGLASKQGADITITKTLDNGFGVIYIEGDNATINTPYVKNNKGVIKGDSINVKTNVFNNISGFVLSEKQLDIDAAELTNDNSADFKNEMGFYIGQPNQKGGLISKGGMKLKGNKIQTNNGRIVAEQGDLDINISSINNTNGLIASHKNTSVVTTSLTNSQGILFGEGKLTLLTDKLKNNSSGSIESNNLKGAIASNGITEITVNSDFENNGIISGIENLRVNVDGKYTNTNESIMSGKEHFELDVKGNIMNRGILNSLKDTIISGQNITNDKSGIIVGRESIEINNSGSYTNNGKIIGSINK